MIALLAVEARRTLARRMTKALALIVLGVWLLIAVVTAVEQTELDTFTLDDVRDHVRNSWFFMLLLAWLIGASFIGAEWNYRTMTTTLTWEPRRLRLIVAKLLACAAVVFVGVVIATLVFAMLLAVIVGVDNGSAATWPDVGTAALRVGVVAAVAATLGAALATITRNTAGAIGAAFVYLVMVESVLGGFRPGWQPWLLRENLDRFAAGGGAFDTAVRSPNEALLIVLAYVLAVAAVSAVVFERRDVG